MFAVRIRSKKGVENVSLEPSLSLKELQKIICEKTGFPAIKLLAGYPPKHVTADPNSSISSIFSKGEMINVEEDASAQPQQPTIQPAVQATAKPQDKPAVAQPAYAPPVGDGEGYMVRRKIADDNSCLFNAVGYVLEGKTRSKAPQLRSLIASLVVADPDEYSDAVLGQPNPEYAQWIMEPKSWGGAIELSILAQHYQAEIAAFDVSTKKLYCYGEGQGYSQRVYLIYDGIHYDSIALNPLEDGSEDFDVTVFSPYDQYAQTKAAALVDHLNQTHQFTDTARFQLLCKQCNKVLTGEKEAALHATSTGHSDFVESK